MHRNGPQASKVSIGRKVITELKSMGDKIFGIKYKVEISQPVLSFLHVILLLGTPGQPPP